MPKTKLLAVCAPDHYLLRNFEPLRRETDLFISDDIKKLALQAAEAEVVMYSGLTGNRVPMKQLWPLLKSVRWIHSLSAGVEKVLVPEMRASDVIVTNARGVFKRSLAEFAVLAALFFYKRVRRLLDSQAARRWDDFGVEMMQDRWAAIVGYGEIGRECALLLRGMGMQIAALRRRPEKSQGDELVAKVFGPSQLHEMLALADVVVAAAPHTPETHHLLSHAEFAAMKRSAIVVNVGRGPVIDEKELVAALESGTIAAAALDVFEREPLPPDSPLWGMSNVLISPHCTDRTVDPDWLDLTAQFFVRNYERYSKGEPLENIVDKSAGY